MRCAVDKVITIIAIISVCIIGLIRKLFYINDLNKRHDFLTEYNNKFVDLINKKLNGSFDQEEYMWLTKNVNKMHNELGAMAFVDYIDRLKGIKVTNYAFLLNFLPQIQQENYFRNSIMDKNFSDSAKACTDMFIRHDGDLSEWKERSKKEIYNPFSLFGEGLKYILQLPINCLYWIGFISLNTASKIKTNIVVKLVNKMIMLLTILSAIVSMIVGWNDFVAIIVRFITNFKIWVIK